ncbi:N-acetylmuramoyl-L-alanine amidase, partial [Alloalcanivorax venustensis]
MDADLAFDVSALDYKDSPIENIRVGKHEDKTRVVFDLSAAVRPRTNLLKPVDPHSWRLVVDLFDSDPKPVKTIEEPEADSGEPRQMIVAIDPGHGGEDPGALGPGNLLEKEVVLQIARKVKARIDREPGMKAVMVRDGDYYVPLAERRRVARQDNHADVFISIH